MIRIGVTGTDTGVGKSVVAAALLAMLRARGVRVAGMKPVETGVAPGDPAADAWLLRRAAGGEDAEEDVRPILLREPLAPWVAARREGTSVDLARLDEVYARLCEGRGAIVVEGAGGLLVPFTRDVAFDGLCVMWGLDLVVVALNRLGVLNHTLMTVRCAHDAGLRVRGVVLNAGPNALAGAAEETNRDALAELVAPVPVLAFPRVADPRDPAALAAAAETAGLDALAADREPPPASSS